MEIIKVVKGENREGLDKYYISVQNKRFKEYMVSITVDDGKVTNVVGLVKFSFVHTVAFPFNLSNPIC